MNAAALSEPRARRFDLPSRGGEMAALEFGPPERPIDIVFSHANGFNARTYRTILGPLGDGLRVLALDLRGHGASTLPTKTGGWAGWPGFAADLVALLEVATETPVLLAGHSLGATTSLLAAGLAPHRVRSLVLFEPVLLDRSLREHDLSALPIARNALRRRVDFRDRDQALAAYRGRGAFATWSEAQLDDYVAAGFRDEPDGTVALVCPPEWEAMTYAHHDYDALGALKAAACPVRILAGIDGSSVGSEAREFATAGGAELEIVPRASHFLPMEHPELVRQALREAAAGG